MTALLLLGAIAAAIIVQLLLGFGIGLWRGRLTLGLPSSPAVTIAASPSTAAWAGWRDFRVVRRSYEDLSETQCSFYLTPVDGEVPPTYAPGQFLTISVDAADPVSGTPRSYVRCYSLSDAPDTATYRITIKRSVAPLDRPDLPAGVVSRRFIDSLREGDVLKAKAPSGGFQLHADPSTPAVFVAGGIGVTPILSMLRWSLAHQPARLIHLFYGVRNGGDHAFKSVLEDMAREHPNFHLFVFYAAPGPDDLKGRDFQEQGFIDVNALKRLLPHGRREFYVCGPPPMMANLVPALGVWGVPAADIRFEAFGPASIVTSQDSDTATRPGQQPAIEIKFRRSGRTLAWTGEDANLLDFAERNNLSVESGCRTGNCGSCETRLISGEVRYLRKPEHDLAPDRCLLCVATPVSALVLEA